MAGKNNTTRIEELEAYTRNLSARLDVDEVLLLRIAGSLEKGAELSETHASRIIIIEQQLLLLVDVKTCLASCAAIEKDLVALKKDVEQLHGWKSDIKKEREEHLRRWWSFGPNVAAALIGGTITLIGVAANVGITYWLRLPK